MVLILDKTPTGAADASPTPTLSGLDRAGLSAALTAIDVPDRQLKMRVEQLWSWLYVRGAASFDTMSDMSKDLRARLAAAYTLERPEIVTEQISADGTRKWLLRLPGAGTRHVRPRSRPSTSRKRTAARFASRAKSAARSPAPSATPARNAWCAISKLRRSSARSCWRATASATGRALPRRRTPACCPPARRRSPTSCSWAWASRSTTSTTSRRP